MRALAAICLSSIVLASAGRAFADEAEMMIVVAWAFFLGFCCGAKGRRIAMRKPVV